MCGIAGFLLREQLAELSTVRSMCDQIRHRGPDDEGFHVDGGCAIGMRRLSIIDLSTGHQPMSNEDQSVWVVFNGEIYNYQSLRQDLIARRATASAPTATPRRWFIFTKQEGVEGIAKLRGMFAYAIWDAATAQAAAGAGPLRQEAAVLRRAAAGVVFWQRAEMPARGRRAAGARSGSAAAVFSVHLHPRSVDAVSRHPQTAARRMADL